MVGGYDDKVDMLVSMGFDKDKSINALNSCNGDLENAVTKLLSGSDEGGTGEVEISSRRRINDNPESAASTMTVVQSEMSQYTLPNGRSACTCISLVAARDFLSRVDSSPSSFSSSEHPQNILTTEFLQNIIVSGVSVYNNNKANNNKSAMEHMSAEEVLQNDPSSLSSLVLRGNIRQGVLSSPQSGGGGWDNNPLGFKAQLQSCRNQEEESYNSKWMAVVISKTPETVCTLIPPLTLEAPFILIDSHPRHQQFQIDGSYIKFHSTMDDLIRSLQDIFPYTSLGYDVSETMAMMYNSFDLYALQSNTV